jgi:TRAP-type C4-dicarboxylate transport system permease small subunit
MKRNRLFGVINKFDDIVSSLFMGIIVSLATANVFMRYVLGRPWGWAEEVTIFLFVWVSALGAASMVKGEGHCSIDVAVRRLPPGIRRFVNIVDYFMVLITLVLIIWYGVLLAAGASSKITPILKIPYTWVDISLPVASIWMLVYYSRYLWQEIKGRSDREAGE